MVISLYSPKGSRDAQFLNNYAMINVRDALLRVPGIAQVDLYGGAEYGMRVWLRPDRLAALGLTPADVISAIKEQNLQAPAGQVGAAPSPPGQEFTYTVKAPGRLVTAEEFENIILRQTAGGGTLRIKDVGRAELGSENYKSFGRAIVKDSTGKWLEGAAASLTVFLLPGANQLASAEGIYHTLEELDSYFPTDMAYEIVYDTTPAVEASIEAILHTLVEAFILVSLVVFVFLQSFRATIIPLLTVPVSLIGTFIFFPLLGFSINTLTMFGLVLAIGIVVDDAIVVVEAVIHHIEHGKSPHDATVQAMKEVSGPVVAIALILSAVFVPVALLGGLTGRLYQQFALTIAISVLLSAFLALSLAPALCAMILKPAKPTGGPLGAFYRGFNKVFEVTTGTYVNWTKLFVRRGDPHHRGRSCWRRVATGRARARRSRRGSCPTRTWASSCSTSSFRRPPRWSGPRAWCGRSSRCSSGTEGIVACTGVGGLGILTNSFSPEFASFFCKLEPWEERTRPSCTSPASSRRCGASWPPSRARSSSPSLRPRFPDSARRAGSTSCSRTAAGRSRWRSWASRPRPSWRRRGSGPSSPTCSRRSTRRCPRSGSSWTGRRRARLGVPVNDVFAALSASMGGAYVNDFNRFGRLYRVYVQAEPQFRQRPEDIGQFYVRSRTTNEMVPLSTLVTVTPVSGTEITVRFNLFRSVEISGGPAPGYTSGQA